MGRHIVFFLMLFCVFTLCEMRKKTMDYPTEKQLTLQRKETTPVDFTRLLVMRVVYGLAKAMGFQEPISEVLNGALVPPGADDDDDFDDDDDDDIFSDY
ncbi:uncharacterized protein LOC125071852 [Vanessa atalanta]|uniref:uncharacterized protein LOC125071852 n=1 Tax=Vanessa atalanta TaxID=42275 RepID=UPI000E775DD0|nr:uncharacterized protein LOC113396909 [Vanessa tameamea]XP_047538210.1 uncharacterized protein LOC125071852 [Vanessa atalanta]